jgi:hypothetical protein
MSQQFWLIGLLRLAALLVELRCWWILRRSAPTASTCCAEIREKLAS